MAAGNPRKPRGSKDSDPQKPARRRNRRAEAAASPWWLGPPKVPGDESEDSGLLAAHELVGMFDMLANAIADERRERITIRRGRPSKKAKALAEAESLVEVAEGFETERAREIARTALELSPDCARAHVLLAELSDDVHAAEREYRLGVAAGERALGAAVIERHRGELGRVVEARGLLQAHRGLAECLSSMGRPAEAIAECELLAALDTDDHAVARFMHLDLLITSREFAAARQLCDECQQEVFCHWPFGRALAAFGEGGDTPEARRLLAAAVAANPHVPRVLLSGREVDPDGMVTVGGEDEAELYARDFRRCWMDVPGAIAWLRAAADVPVERRGRHDRPDRHDRPVRPDRRRGGGDRSARREQPAGEPHLSWPEEKRLLTRLPLDPTDEWEADLTEQREGMWCFHVASARDERPVALEILEDRPLPDDLWSALAGALRRPMLGEPRRPATLAVRPGVFPKTWQRKLEQIGIRHVVQDDLPTIVGISRDVVEARVVHVVVMGQSGLVQGIAVYEDEGALEIARSGDLERVAGSTGLTVMFGEGFEIPAIDYDWIETHGFEVAGPEAWPQPVRQNPGMNLRPPLVWELELLTGCLRDVPAFIAAVPPGGRGAAGSRDATPWTSAAGWRLGWEPA